jgi:acyl carrier protein
MKNTTEELKPFLETFCSKKLAQISEDLRITEDLGIDGDDAQELMDSYSAHFGVDLSCFEFRDYFFDEGFSPSGLKGFFSSTCQCKSLLVKDLEQGIIEGILRPSS